jgi:single-strand DNA-binding protein
MELKTMVNKVIFIGRLEKNAEVKTAQNNKECVVFSPATSESWKNEKGDYENRTEWYRVYAWSNLSSFAKALQKGQRGSNGNGESISKKSSLGVYLSVNFTIRF